MKPFRLHKGKLVPLLKDNIDTDQIIPKQYLKSIKRTGYGVNLFDEWRYLEDGTDNPEFPLNQPQYQDATILLTGENFGCGSSREHAPWALSDFGFKVIIAGSYADIFYMNCIKNGILTISLDEGERMKLNKLSIDEEIIIDLEHQKIVCGVYSLDFDIDSQWKEKLLLGLDDVETTLIYEDKIKEYESLNNL